MLCFILYLKFLDSKKLLKLLFALICSLCLEYQFNLLYKFKKCPECYGDELCRFFQNNQIQLSWFSFFLSIINPHLTKSVFYGVFNETEVVIKRKTERNSVLGYDELKLNFDVAQNAIFCPSVKNGKFLLSHIEGDIKEKKFWMDVKKSIEPLLLVFFQEEDNWPFPKYYGACGDLIVEEYKGKPLSNFLYSDFKKRCFLAISLLQMADLFTFGHPTLAFYFTDYSLHNLVVDSHGKVSLIDLDNVIISNRSTNLENPFQNKGTHISEILDDHKYAFSPYDICNHNVSDHNYFSVCKYLFAHPEDGLLRDIPIEFHGHKELAELVNECTHPAVMKDRFSAGQKLQIMLEKIAGDYNWLE